MPQAGDRFVVFSDEKQARRIGEARHEENILQQRQESKNVSLDNLFEQMKQGEMKDLNDVCNLSTTCTHSSKSSMSWCI